MANKVIIFSVLIFVSSFLSAWEKEDVNGTYLYEEEHLQSPLILEKVFSWGKGLRLPEAAIEFDLRKKSVLMPGMGEYEIETIYKDEQGSICLILFYVGDEDHENPIHMKITFIDSHRLYITHDHWERSLERRYSQEAKWVWYRLSGPTGKK